MYAGVPTDVPSCVSARVGAGRARRADRLRDAEVGDDGGAARQQHVVRLDVAVHDAVLVRVRERARDVAQDADDLRNRQRAVARRAARAATRPRRTASCRTARRSTCPGGEHGNDVRLLQARGEVDLALEAIDVDAGASSAGGP